MIQALKITFEYLGEDRDFEGSKFWHVDAIHVTTTGNRRKFTQAELEHAAVSLSFRPLDINHDESRALPFPQNSTMEMDFDNSKMSVSGRIRITDHLINAQIESGFLTDVSIEQIPTKGESCINLICEQHGVAFVGLAILERGIIPGDNRAKIIKGESITFSNDIVNLMVSNAQRECKDCTDFTPCHECTHNTEQNDDCMSKAINEITKAHPDWDKDKVLAVAISKCGVNKSTKEAWGYHERFTPLTEALVKKKRLEAGNPNHAPSGTSKGGQFTSGGGSGGTTKDTPKAALQKRGIKGDDLLNQLDKIDTFKDAGAKVNPDATVTVFHFTSKSNQDTIRSTGVMKGAEDGIFFTTKKDGDAAGFGDAVISADIPIDMLDIDDDFGDELHLRIPTDKIGQKVDVGKFLNKESLFKKKLEFNFEEIVSEALQAFTHTSSWIGNVRYDTESKVMRILMNGKSFEHCNVEQIDYDKFEGAPSKGEHWWREIKDQFNC